MINNPDVKARPQRTSHTYPLQIAELMTPKGGVVGITFCPGKQQEQAMTGAWARDLAVDLEAVKAWGAGLVLTLVTNEELNALKVERLGSAVQALGMKWLHLPIEDVSIPTADWERRWRAERGQVHAELERGGRVLVHCKGGLGRAGLVGALILVESGLSPRQAIAAVRAARPGAIETAAQAKYLLHLKPRRSGS